MKTISYILSLCLVVLALNSCGCSGEPENQQNNNLIGDPTPMDFTINLVDANGNNVVNDENLQKVCDYVSIVYRWNTFKLHAATDNDDNGLTYRKNPQTNEYEIIFHQFRGDQSNRNVHFQVKWGDGTVTNVTFSNKFEIKDGKLDVDWWFDINGQTTKIWKQGTTITKVVSF